MPSCSIAQKKSWNLWMKYDEIVSIQVFPWKISIHFPMSRVHPLGAPREGHLVSPRWDIDPRPSPRRSRGPPAPWRRAGAGLRWRPPHLRKHVENVGKTRGENIWKHALFIAPIKKWWFPNMGVYPLFFWGMVYNLEHPNLKYIDLKWMI